MAYSEYIKTMVRQGMGLNAHDTSMDKYIDEMSPDIIFRDVCRWHGLLGGRYLQIASWIRGIYGIDLHEISEKMEGCDNSEVKRVV